MKQKIRLFFLFLSLSFFVGSTALLCNPQSTATGNNNNEPEIEITEILDGPHPFYDAGILENAFEAEEEKVKIFGKEETAQKIILEKNKLLSVLMVLKKYLKNENLKAMHERLIEETLGGKLRIGRFFSEYVKLINEEDGFKEKTLLRKYILGLLNGLGKFTIPGKTISLPPAPETSIIEPGVTIPTGKGIVSPTMLVDALGSFIAKRFKEELSIRYLEKFRDKLNKTDLKILFPSTIKFLLSSHIFNFKTFMSTLKEAFQNDLNDMGSNLYNFLEKMSDSISAKIKKCQTKIENSGKDDPKKGELEKKKANLMKKKKMLSRVLFLWNIVKKIKEGEHPGRVIGNLDNLEYIDEFDNNKGADAIRFLVWVARSLINKEGDGWIWKGKGKEIDPKKFFDSLIKNKNKEDLYLGFFYAGLMKELRNDELKGAIKAKLKKVKVIKDYMNEAMIIAKKIQDQINEMKEKFNRIKFEDYKSYLYTISGFIELGTDIIKEVSNPNDFEKIEEYLGYAKALLEISRNIIDKAYGVAIVNVIELLNAAFPEDTETKKDIVKYLSFLNTMANAQDAKEMQVAMEAFFLPVGSYRMNRANVFSFTVNAYPGGFLSSENLTTEEQIIGNKKAGNIGLAAPIGFALTWSLNKGDYDKPGPSLGLFFSAIDIGAVFNYRLGSNEGLPEITWTNIVAPGVFIMAGYKDSPITIGAGIQYGPQLRKIKPPGAGADAGNLDPEAVISSRSVRIGIIIAVDIPLIRIYQKSKLE